jgi:amino acid adenylation domain-containing protein
LADGLMIAPGSRELSVTGPVSAEPTLEFRSAEPEDYAWTLRQFAGAPSAPSLSRRSATSETASGVRARARLTAGTETSLHDCATRLCVSVEHLLCTVWVTALSRLANEREILIGLEVRTEDEPAAPADLVPLRVDVTPRQSLSELAGQVAARTLEAMRHRTLPYAKLRRALGLRPADPNPLPVTFAFAPHGGPAAPVDATDLRFAVEPVAGGGLSLELDADGARYSQMEAELVLRRLVFALNRLASGGDAELATVSDLQLMDPEELRLVRDVYSAGPAASPPATLAALFASRVAATPDALALVAGDQRLTYRELDAESNRLAREMLARGFAPGDVAVLLLPRTSRLVVALLACVKTGIAYSPLEPAHPSERLAHMVAGSGAKLIIRESSGPPDAGAGLPALRLDDPSVRASVASRSAAPLANPDGRPPTPRDAAYIIFTSGSTGRPKGVVVSNGAIAQQMRAMQRELTVRPGDVVLTLFTIAFDVATFDIFFSLCQGASLVLLDEHEMRDPDLIVRAAVEHDAAILSATPTLWRTLNVALLPSGLSALVIGEQFPPDLLPSLSRLRAVFNWYGPTEAAVSTTIQRVTVQDVVDGVLPIGRPLAGYRTWIVDPGDLPVPLGAVGELCIGGTALAEGYAGEPELTAQRFVACPFADGRMYRTGDLARWRRDGTLEILGRVDSQVKLHGNRIELGEIEQAIRALPWAADAAVVTAGTGAAMHLVAYVVARPGLVAPATAELRAALADQLPEVMRPSVCVALAALPRNASGKLDRSNLPLPLEEAPRTLRPPQSDEEALLRLGFARVTGRPEIAGDDDFFDIGGDSIRAMILVSEIRRAGFAFPMELLFSARTPAAIAAAWRGHEPGGFVTDLRPLVFLLPGAGGDQPGLAKLRANCAESIQFVSLDYPDWSTLVRAGTSLGAIATALAAKIESIAPPGPITLAGYSFGAYVAWHIAETLAAQGRPIGGLILLDANASEDAPDPPRGSLLERGLRQYRVFTEAWREDRLSLTLAENLSFHLTNGRGRVLLRRLTSVRALPLPQTFRTWLRFYVARALHSELALRWLPTWCAERPPTARYPVSVLRAAEARSDRAPDLGWGQYFLDLRVAQVSGDHLTMLDDLGPGSLCAALPREVAALQSDSAHTGLRSS